MSPSTMLGLWAAYRHGRRHERRALQRRIEQVERDREWEMSQELDDGEGLEHGPVNARLDQVFAALQVLGTLALWAFTAWMVIRG